MNEMAEILWNTTVEHLKSATEVLCRDYESNPKYHLKKFFENGKLTGFCVYYDTPEFRVLEGAYNIGNKIGIKEWRWLTDGAKTMRILINKANVKMINFIEKMKFNKIGEDVTSYVFERKV